MADIVRWLWTLLLVPILGALVWVGRVAERVDNNEADMADLKADIASVDSKVAQVLLLLAGREYGSRQTPDSTR